MRYLWISILFSICLSALSAESLHGKIYTLPYDSKAALRAMLHRIDTAGHRIDAAIYSFTHKAIAKHLAKAAKRGVRIRIIFDKASNLRNRKSQLGYLAKYRNIRTMLLEGKPYGGRNGDNALMHMKMMVIDGKYLIAGSANWTYSAFGKNYEILCIMEDYATAKRAERAFEKMVRSAKPY